MNKQELISTLKALDALDAEQKAYLINLVNTKKKYGLVWEDKPEDVEELLRQHLPVLTEVPERRILATTVEKAAEVPAVQRHEVQATLSFAQTPGPTNNLRGSTLLQGTTPEVVAPTPPDHILVEGDNLHALTALTFSHEGKVDVIYIDPPYNTGNKDFKYNDRFVDREDSYRHSKWLSFMHKRLLIAKRLLAETGVIFISIDDNEQAQLKLLCDEVFGEENFVGELIWEKGKKGDSKFFSITHEYILTYVSSRSLLLLNNVRWRKKKEGLDGVLEKYEDLKLLHKGNHELIRKALMKWYNSLPKDDSRKKHKHYNYSDDRGLYFAADFAGPDDGRLNRPRYDILHPETGKACSKPSTGWRWDETTTLDALAQNPPRIHFGKDETTIPCRKSYLLEIDSEPFQSVFYKDGRSATLQVEELLGKGKFKFPKDTEILGKLIALNSESNSIILDFFAGSGTTLHATMQLNDEDGGNRQCILVTNNENNIAEEVCYERNRRVIQGYTNAKGQEVAGLTNNSLRYYRCEKVPSARTEQNRRLLTRQSTELLKIKEGCYVDITEASSFDPATCFVGTNERGKYTVVVYHTRRPQPLIAALCTFIQALPDRREKVRLYAFSEEKDALLADFQSVADAIEGVPLPEAIYNAYRATFRTLGLDKKPPRTPETEADEAETDAEQPSLEFTSHPN